MKRSFAGLVALGFIGSLVACGYASDASFDDNSSGGVGGLPGMPGSGGGGGSGGSGGVSSSGSSGGASSGAPVLPEPTCTDGIKNGTEPDVDCGGGCVNVCAVGAGCAVGEDCAERVCASGQCQPATGVDLVQNGDETDVDCGGVSTGAPKCAAGQHCLVRGDCATRGCKDGVCLEAPSCAVHFGGDTCGSGEIYPPDGNAVNHESCCRSLPIAGYADANHPGKTVYLDKYEITAGRMRAFLDALSEGGNPPDVKAFIEAYVAGAPPGLRWNPAWTEILPTSNEGELFTFNTPTGTQYPDNATYAVTSTQPTWSIVNGAHSINTGVYTELGGTALYPEFTPDYAQYHNFNCNNGAGSYGFSTYWFPNDVVAGYGAGIGKANDQDALDQKALNCAPNALFAAFCAWDGGQLATAEAVDAVLAGSPGLKVGAGTSNCSNGIISVADMTTAGACGGVYYWPQAATAYDDASRVAAPGRVAADTLVSGGETWNDLNGNLLESVMNADNATFSRRGFGFGHVSIRHHVLQMSLSRGKEAGVGARCMRFK